LDPLHILNKTAELGLVRRPRDHQEPVVYPQVGRFNSKDFHPKEFKYIFPARAFQYYTPRDAYWGAKIVASFTEGQIRAAVDAANYSDPAARDYLVQTLMERREIVCRYWFGRVAPLDHFRRTHLGIEFDDLGIAAGFETAVNTHYRWRDHYEGKVSKWNEPKQPSTLIMWEAVQKKSEQFAVEFQVRRATGGWSKSVTAYFDLVEGSFKLIGVVHDD
jgi:hypothetical protein